MSGSNQMASDGKFGKGPRELTGAVDLISRYRLLNHHSFFCKKPLPLAISDTHYLQNVVGLDDALGKFAERNHLEKLMTSFVPL